jgi:16S rRNA (uracil1498-N3)-methyltransferase
VERDDRSTVGTFFVDAPFAEGTSASLGESAAHHARVKRLAPGELVSLVDGAGHRAMGTISDIRRASMEVFVDSVRSVARPAPIHLRVPIADRERMLMLAEKATELGIATWQAVRFRRSMSVSPRGEGPAFHEKLKARMVSALEQSGGAWLPELLNDTTADALRVEESQRGIVLDVSGAPLASIVTGDALTKAPVLVFGPEGGIEPDELSLLTNAGWRAAKLADTTLRFETAGIAGIAVIRAAHLREGN